MLGHSLVAAAVVGREEVFWLPPSALLALAATIVKVTRHKSHVTSHMNSLHPQEHVVKVTPLR